MKNGLKIIKNEIKEIISLISLGKKYAQSVLSDNSIKIGIRPFHQPVDISIGKHRNYITKIIRKDPRIFFNVSNPAFCFQRVHAFRFNGIG